MKKKFILILSAICLIAIIAISLVACGSLPKSFTITFDTQGGNSVEDVVVKEGQPVVLPNNPIKEGYVFAGWYLDEDFLTLFDVETISVTSDITLYAKWNEQSSLCDHQYEDWVTIQDPTCATEGIKQSTCVYCGLVQYDTITIIGHNLIHHESKQATCINIGWDAYVTCSRCDHTTYVEKDALGHDYQQVKDSAVAPTCTEAGKKADEKCSRCDDLIEGEPIEAICHDWDDGEVTTAPTCLVQGVKTLTCQNDLTHTKTETVAIDPNAHKASQEWTKTVDQHYHVCLNGCDTHLDKDDHVDGDDEDTLCDVCGYHFECHHLNNESIPAVAPSCTKTGLTEGIKCSDCGAIITQQLVEALGHDHQPKADSAVAPTCIEAGKEEDKICSRCDDLIEGAEIEALGHDEISHYAKAPTCKDIGWDAYVTCSRCDYTTYVEKATLGHNEISHDAQQATCINIGWDAYVTCSRCDYTTYKEIPINQQYYDYGLESLKNRSNGQNLEKLYVDMKADCYSFYNDHKDLIGGYINFYDYEEYNISIDEAVLVWKIFYSNNPLFYWLKNEFTVEEGGFRLAIIDEYRLYSNRKSVDKDIENMCNELLEATNGVADSKTLYARIYDFVIKKIDYAYEDDGITPVSDAYAHSIVGASTYNKGVCECYVKTYKLLCDVVNIECIPVPVVDASDNHIIVLIYTDNQWLGADPTYDDRGVLTEYTHYGMTLLEIEANYDVANDPVTDALYLYDIPTISTNGYFRNGLTWIEYAADSFSGGNGTEENPYQIATANELALLSKIVSVNGADYNKKHYILTNDIDLGDHEWFPIGCGSAVSGTVDMVNCFSGCFDGNGYKISNLYINNDLSIQFYGLFGITYQAEIYNVKIENARFSIKSNTRVTVAEDLNNYYHIGGIAGYFSDGSAINCTVNTNMQVQAMNCVGTHLGCAFGCINYSSVNKIFSSGIIDHCGNGAIWIGGFTGDIGNEIIIEESGFVGAISTSISDMHSDEMNQMQYSYVKYIGGFVGSAGRANSSIVIEDCYAKADIQVNALGIAEVGGFMGIKEIVYDTQVYRNLICDSKVDIVNMEEDYNRFISNNTMSYCLKESFNESQDDIIVDFKNCLYYDENYIYMQSTYVPNKTFSVNFSTIIDRVDLDAEDFYFAQLGLDGGKWELSQEGKVVLVGMMELLQDLRKNNKNYIKVSIMEILIYALKRIAHYNKYLSAKHLQKSSAGDKKNIKARSVGGKIAMQCVSIEMIFLTD